MRSPSYISLFTSPLFGSITTPFNSLSVIITPISALRPPNMAVFRLLFRQIWRLLKKPQTVDTLRLKADFLQFCSFFFFYSSKNRTLLSSTTSPYCPFLLKILRNGVYFLPTPGVSGGLRVAFSTSFTDFIIHCVYICADATHNAQIYNAQTKATALRRQQSRRQLKRLMINQEAQRKNQRCFNDYASCLLHVRYTFNSQGL